MTSEQAISQPGTVARAIRTPRAAAVAGIAFSVLFSVALVLVRTAIPADPEDAGRWLSDDSRRDAVLLGLSLVPFAGIAFLWFVGVVRDRVGEAEDRFFATAFLGSGLLFIGMLFVASAVAGGLIVAAERNADTILASGAWEFGRETTYELMVVYAMRMAAIWTLAISTILLRARLAPRWPATRRRWCSRNRRSGLASRSRWAWPSLEAPPCTWRGRTSGSGGGNRSRTWPGTSGDGSTSWPPGPSPRRPSTSSHSTQGFRW